MITFKTGDILAEDTEALINTVNCVGVMGRGIALQFKKAFPRTSRPTPRRASTARFGRAACSCSRLSSSPILA